MLANSAVLISFIGWRTMVRCDVSNCFRLTALFNAPYIPVAKNQNEAKHSSAECTESLLSAQKGLSQWVWLEKKADPFSVNV